MNKILIRIVTGMILCMIVSLISLHVLVSNFYRLLFKDPTWYPIKNTAMLIQYIIENTPSDELFQERDSLQAILDRPIDIVTINDKVVPENIKQQISDVPLIFGTSEDGEKRYYVPTQDGDHLVIFGPSFQQYKPLFKPVPVFLSFLLVSAVAGLVGFWLTRPVSKRLNELEAATEKIRQGYISTRIKIVSTDLISSVRKCFNQMANRIQSLISDRQNLLNAVTQNFQPPIAKIRNQLKRLHALNDMQEIKHLSQTIDQAVNDIEQLANDILIHEKSRRPGHKESSGSNQTHETQNRMIPGGLKKRREGFFLSGDAARSMLQVGVVKLILRMSLGILIVLLFYQSVMIITPRISYRIYINPSWYPVHTMALLIQQAVDRTPQDMLPDQIEAFQKSLNRRIEILPAESKYSFVKTPGQEFSNQMTYGVYNGRNAFFAPVHAGNDILMIDPAFAMYKRKPSILLHAYLLATAFFLTALFGVFLTFPIIRNLKKLLEGIERVGHDDLNARVNIPANKPVGTLARCFNNMVERIQLLLDHQKYLTQAVIHEIRTPVSRIRFHLEMLAEADKEIEIRHHAGEIEEEIKELNRLINELSMFSILDQSKTEITSISVCFHDIFEEIVAYYQKISVQIDIVLFNSSGKELKIIADPVYFKHAVHNILSNAVRHAESKVTIRCDSSVDTIRIEVCDDGPGTPEHARSMVFEPFTRLDDSRSRQSGGFGLGLAIVKRILSIHGATISVGDNFPHGAKIIICWPSESPS